MRVLEGARGDGGMEELLNSEAFEVVDSGADLVDS